MGEVLYPFLDLKTPKDTSTASLNNKITHAIYQCIVRKTSLQNAKNSSLFTTDTKIDGVVLNTKAEYTTPLKRLIEDKLVQHIFYFFVNDQKIEIQSSFIALPIDKTISLTQIFNHVVEVSLNNLEYFLNYQIDFDSRDLFEEFEKSAKENLPLNSTNYPKSIVQIFQSIENYSGEIPLHHLVSQTIMKEIEEVLISKNKIVKIDEGLYIPLAKDEIIGRFETADHYIKTKMRPLAGTDLSDEIEIINKDEESYRLTPFQEVDISFQIKRARLLHHFASKNSPHYPGELPILTVLLLEKPAFESYKKHQDDQILSETEKIKNKFNEFSEDWRMLIHFFNEETVSSKHPKIWENLKKDNSLSFTEWYVKKEEILVFASKKTHIFLSIIKNMADHPPAFSWQILAFKQLLEKYEKSLPGLFINKEFLKRYAELLRIAYVDYFPWFYHILFFFDFFRDLFFASAKQRITREQEIYRAKIQKNKFEKEQKKTVQRLHLIEVRANEKKRKEIIEALDEYYFKNKVIPTNGMIMEKCRVEKKQLQAILQKENFQLVPLIQGGGFESVGVLFPMDHNWRKKELKLRKILLERIEYLSDTTTIKNDSELIQLKSLYNHILSRSSNPHEED